MYGFDPNNQYMGVNNQLFNNFLQSQTPVPNYAPDSGLIPVKSREEVDNFNLGNRDAVALWHVSKPIVYIKYMDKTNGPPYYPKVRTLSISPLEESNVQDAEFEEVVETGPSNTDILNGLNEIRDLIKQLM